MALDSDSKKSLEEAKKGKPRKFAMVCKGPKILSLVVYKKGSEEKYKKEAKKAGKGQYYGGVICGKGMNLVFELLRESYEKAPGKDLILKEFLKSEAGMSFKPVYEIVDELTEVGLDSVASAEGEETEPVVPEETEAVVPEQAEAVDPLKSQLTEALKKLTPQISQAVGSDPARKSEIMQRVSDIRDSLENDRLQDAKSDLTELGELLRQNNATKPEDARQVEPPAEPAKPDKNAVIAAKLTEALDKLRPQLNEAIAAHPSSEDDLLEKVSQIVDAIGENRFPAAKQNIGSLGHALKTLLALPPVPNRMPEFLERRESIESRLLEAQKAVPDRASKLLQVWDYAQEQADKQDFATAFKALDGLESTIAKLLAAEPQTDTERFGITDGIVEERRAELEDFFRERVSQARDESEFAVVRLEDAFEDHTEQAADLAEAINQKLQGLYDEIEGTIGQAIKTGSVANIEKAMDSCRNQVASDELIQHSRSTKRILGIDPGIEQQFERLFTSAKDALQAQLETAD